MNLPYSQVTLTKYLDFAKSLPQSLLLIAPEGSGKKELLQSLATEVLGDSSKQRLFEISPVVDSKTIGIDTIRQLKNDLRLKSDKTRVVLIDNAGRLTKEAQNSLLKILEEPPRHVHFLLSINSVVDVLDTIKSRSVLWYLTPPNVTEILDYFNESGQDDVKKAIAFAGNRSRHVSSFLNTESDNSKRESIAMAKEIYAGKHFDRLIIANKIAKDSHTVNDLVESLIFVSDAALKNAAIQNSSKVLNWQKRLSYCLQAQAWLNLKIQPKLVLTYLFIVL